MTKWEEDAMDRDARACCRGLGCGEKLKLTFPDDDGTMDAKDAMGILRPMDVVIVLVVENMSFRS